MLGSGRTLTTMFVVGLSSWSCSSTAPDAVPKVAAVVVSPATSTLAPSAQLPLRAEVQDGSGDLLVDAAVTWTVQDPGVVSVSEAGVVTALSVGTSQVAASALGKSGIAIVTVKPESVNPGTSNPGTGTEGTGNQGGTQGTGTQPVVATVTVTAPSRKVKPGSTMQLTATAKDANGNSVAHQSFFWSSSNTNTATVSESGIVTGKRPGDATITARTSSSGGKSGSVEIEVK